MSSTEVTTQTPPGWLELSAGDRHLIVRAAADVADDLRGPLEAGVVEVLDALAGDGLAALPDFALVDTSGEQARVMVRGAALVRADGSEVTADGRMPWRDLDLSAAVLELAGPGGRGGWKRPKRLGRVGVATAGAAEAEVAAPVDEPEPEPVMDHEPEPVMDHEREPVMDHEPVAEEPERQPEGEPDVEPEGEPDAEPEEPAEGRATSAAVPAPAPPADLTLPPSEEYAGVAPAERVTPSEPQPEKKVLIDSVPWRTLPEEDPSAAGTQAPAPAVAPVPPPPGESAGEAAVGPTGPDNWGLTGPPPMPHSLDEPAPAPAKAPASESESVSQAQEQPEARAESEPEAPNPSAPRVPDVTMDRGALAPAADGPVDSPIVLAVICPAGHHSSPHASNCRVCGRDIPTQQPFQTPRPQLGVFRVSTGGLVPLDRGILLGRSPKVNADLPPSSRPHLVRLASRDNDISRNHAEVILEGWHVLVRDLGSTNGTTVTLPGEEPVRLRPTEDFGIEPGAVVTLADEVVLTYEVAE